MKRLVLFDIDETILHSDGVGRRAMQTAMSKVFAREINADGHNMSGKTDPQICAEVLSGYGLSEDEIQERLAELFEIYIEQLEQEIARARLYKLHAGVDKLIEALVDAQWCYLGLLTGNIEPGARLKLSVFDLNRHFSFGAFGCDSHNRLHLPAIAHKRAANTFNLDFAVDEIVIIGDAVNDILCAQGYGVKSVITCTGRTPRNELEALNPSFLFPSLADTNAVIEAIVQ